jgi:hypothetical protein
MHCDGHWNGMQEGGGMRQGDMKGMEGREVLPVMSKTVCSISSTSPPKQNLIYLHKCLSQNWISEEWVYEWSRGKIKER